MLLTRKFLGQALEVPLPNAMLQYMVNDSGAEDTYGCKARNSTTNDYHTQMFHCLMIQQIINGLKCAQCDQKKDAMSLDGEYVKTIVLSSGVIQY